MKNEKIKLFLKCVLFGVIWAFISFGISLIINKFMDYSIKDIFFVEGIILIMIGIFSSIGGDPMGLSLQSLGNSNAQYVSNANLKVAEIEKKINKSEARKVTISTSLSGFSLIVGGAICIIINHIL